jgi:nucleotide-binding universal stress UspA family protein
VSRLLVPLDGSECARRALAHAISATRGDPAGFIHLVTVQHELPPYPTVGVVYASHEALLARQRNEGATLLAPGERMLEDAGLAHASEIVTGRPAPTIAARADAHGCDSIVMGTRGMGNAGNLLLGSVAAAVVHAANVPVTLVK